MRKKASLVRSSAEGLTPAELEQHAEGWLLDGEIRQHSRRTTGARRELIQKLLWFLRHREYPEVGTRELRAFLAYCSRGHEEPGGRWGNPRCAGPVRPSTVATYHGHLRTLFRFLVAEEAIAESPMEAIRPPVVRDDQVQPFTQEQVDALIAAAKKSYDPKRNELIVWLLVDTGMRASELCDLTRGDVNLSGRWLSVLGKGNKRRTLYFGAATTRAFWAYLRDVGDMPERQPVFTAGAGRKPGERLTSSGLLQLFHRLGAAACVEGVRCSPHTARHYFAVEFLRDGGNVFTLKELLGHTTLRMVNRYVQLAQADLENQHRQHSPGDRLKRRRNQ